jgi:multiple sugar transport system permease protein
VRQATLARCLVLALILAIVFVPMYWIVVTSFKTGRQILLSESVYVPRPFTIDNYVYLFQESRFALWIRNSAITATASTLLSLAIGTLGAYALTRLRFPGRRTFGGLVLVTYLVPPGLMFIPLYQTFIRIGYTDSLGTLILAYPTFLVPFVTWLLMGFFRSIPRELEEAALVDGATRTQALLRVVLPLAAPGLLAAGLFCFTLSWNEFLYALIFIADDNLRTLPVGLSEFVVSDFAFWGQLMAAAALASLPVVLVYIYLHKYMVGGLTAGSVKG